MASKTIHAIYNDDDLLLHAVKQVREARYHIGEVYTPFPVHGLDKAVGEAPTRLAITSFLYGITGLSVAVLMMNFMMYRLIVLKRPKTVLTDLNAYGWWVYSHFSHRSCGFSRRNFARLRIPNFHISKNSLSKNL